MTKRYLVCLILLLALLAARAQSFQFRHLDVSDGLSGNFVRTICKDRDGFVWFGTSAGLSRYDGYAFKRYAHEEGDPYSLPDNNVSHLDEMPDGRFWVRTGKGYVLFDRRTDRFTADLAPFMRSLGSKGVPDRVYTARNGCTWIAVGTEGCYRYREGEPAGFFSFAQAELPAGGVSCIGECKDGILLAFESGLLACLHPQDLRLKWTEERVRKAVPEGRKVDFSLFVDREDCIWMYGTPGVWVYNSLRRSWDDGIASPWNHRTDFVHSIVQDARGRIWLGKDYSGIDILDKSTGKVETLKNDERDERSLAHNTVWCLYADRDGLMWAGTYKKGISYYGESIFKFNLYKLGDVTSMARAAHGRLWLGTNDRGVLLWNSLTGAVERHWPLGGDPVVALLQARDGRLWVGTFNGGLYCIDNGQVRSFRSAGAGTLAGNSVWSLAEDTAGRIWIGLLDSGVQCLDPTTLHFESFDLTRLGLLGNYVSSLCFTRDGTLAVGTPGQGVLFIDVKERRRKLLLQENDGGGLANNGVNQVYADSRGLLWIATNGGLNLYDPARKTLADFKDTLQENGSFIGAIVEDEDRNLWISSARKLINLKVLEEADGRYRFASRVYDEKDGLQGGDLNLRAMARMDGGRIALGGLYGVNTFLPRGMRDNRILPRVLFAGLSLFGRPVQVGEECGGSVLLPGELNSMQRIVLDYSQNIVTVDLASDNLSFPSRTRYKYQLDGFSPEWFSLPEGVRSVTFTNLAPGTYVLNAKAVNSDGYEGTSVSSLGIQVLPPWWMSWWAYLIYILLAVLLLVWGRHVLLRREREKFRIRQIEQEAAKNEEINNMKFRFFTNVSHELRTPLTLILSPLEGMLKEVTDGRQRMRLELMYRNAQRLLVQVNQLLDFRKGEMSEHHLSLSEGDVVTFVKGVCDSFLLMADKKHIHFSFFSGVEEFSMAFDADKLGKIVMNLLSNAFKYTPEGGRVTVMLEHISESTDMLEIKVSDTGMGISEADKEHIFERFYQAGNKTGETSPAGTGVGLSLVRDFVSLHGGEVKVFDNIGKGTVFLVQIPVKHVEERLPQNTSAESEEARPVSGETKGQIQPADRKDFPLLLVVDDNEDFRTFMRYSLELQYRVKLARDGKEAWKMIQECPPDLVISDVMMPVMDGNELCRMVKQDRRTAHIPVILLTARQATESKVEGLQTGADDYVTKPFNMTVLVLRIRKLIELSRYNRATQGTIDPTPSDIVITSLDEKLIEKAIKYVEDNISRPELSVEEMSRELGMSRVHLYKKLLQITGKTPIEFIRVIRLKRAAQLLRESQLHVSEVAFEVGFNSPRNFTKYFKDEFGMLPSAYVEKEGK